MTGQDPPKLTLKYMRGIFQGTPRSTLTIENKIVVKTSKDVMYLEISLALLSAVSLASVVMTFRPWLFKRQQRRRMNNGSRKIKRG